MSESENLRAAVEQHKRHNDALERDQGLREIRKIIETARSMELSLARGAVMTEAHTIAILRMIQSLGVQVAARAWDGAAYRQLSAGGTSGESGSGRSTAGEPSASAPESSAGSSWSSSEKSATSPRV